MEKESLHHLLDLGMTLEQIGARFDRDPSTIRYWLRKHGLQAVGSAKHSGRGGIDRDRLEALVAEGFSQADMASELGVSASTVGYWLRRHELVTIRSKRRADGRRGKAEGKLVAEMRCRHHGLTDFWLEGRGAYRCIACRSGHVAARRRRVKKILVSEAGGRCQICGYSRSVAALHFHHLDPAEKRFGLGREGVTRSLAEMREEARKCALLCANCHAEVEAGVAKLQAA